MTKRGIPAYQSKSYVLRITSKLCEVNTTSQQRAGRYRGVTLRHREIASGTRCIQMAMENRLPFPDFFVPYNA